MRNSTRFIFLHLACTARKPETWRFHAAGIAREFKRLRPLLNSAASFMTSIL